MGITVARLSGGAKVSKLSLGQCCHIWLTSARQNFKLLKPVNKLASQIWRKTFLSSQIFNTFQSEANKMLTCPEGVYLITRRTENLLKGTNS